MRGWMNVVLPADQKRRITYPAGLTFLFASGDFSGRRRVCLPGEPNHPSRRQCRNATSCSAAQRLDDPGRHCRQLRPPMEPAALRGGAGDDWIAACWLPTTIGWLPAGSSKSALGFVGLPYRSPRSIPAEGTSARHDDPPCGTLFPAALHALWPG
jgi:hypothetical protein